MPRPLAHHMTYLQIEKQFQLHLFQISPGAKTSTHGFHGEKSPWWDPWVPMVPIGSVRAGVTRDTILKLARRLTSTESGLLTSVQAWEGPGKGPIAGVLVVSFMENGGLFLWKIPQNPQNPDFNISIWEIASHFWRKSPFLEVHNMHFSYCFGGIWRVLMKIPCLG